MEFFKKNKTDLNETKKTHIDKNISLDSKSKKTLKSLKTAQEKYIESACFFLIQETAIEKIIRSIKKAGSVIVCNRSRICIPTFKLNSNLTNFIHLFI